MSYCTRLQLGKSGAQYGNLQQLRRCAAYHCIHTFVASRRFGAGFQGDDSKKQRYIIGRGVFYFPLYINYLARLIPFLLTPVRGGARSTGGVKRDNQR